MDFRSWQPACDMYVTHHEVVVKLELAGVRPTDISVVVGERFIVVSGERPQSDPGSARENVFYSLEIPYGGFYRQIALPFPVETSEPSHELRDGILTLRFAITKPRVIPVE